MTSKRMHPKTASTTAGADERPLQGDEAVELYAAEIARKIAALSEQTDLLRAEIVQSGQLLDAIGRDK